MASKTLITSGKGGVGKSTICCLLGVALASLGRKILIIELDSGLRSLDIMLGTENQSAFDLGDVLSGHCAIEQSILHCSYSKNLDLIAAPLNFSDMNFRNLKPFCDNVSTKYDHILLDSPAGCGSGFQSTLNIVDNALIIVTPDPVCVRDATKISQILVNHQVDNQRIIINRVGRKYKKLNIFSDLDSILDTIGVRLLGVVPEELKIIQSTSKGMPLPKGNKAFIAINNIARRFIGQDVPLYIN